jgi:hypothetical protein
MGCTRHFVDQGSWSGCVQFLRWRAQTTGRVVHAELGPEDLLRAVNGCTSEVGAGQFETCTVRVLDCVSRLWAEDNYACLAGGGGNSCLRLCK